MKHIDVFEKLCTSAFDFLERSASEIEEQPKYALIHFCSGLELILKARLLYKHWSLVVTTKPDLAKFVAGNFESVGLAAAIDRIQTVLGEALPKDAQSAFEKVAQHRNRVVHFVHDMEDGSRNQLRQSVAADICLGWLHLRDRLDHWGTQFRSFKNQVLQLNFKMQRVRTFLQVVFDKKKPELEALKKSGSQVALCPACNFEAAIVRQHARDLFYQNCVVCNHSVHLVEFECGDPSCGMVHRLSGYNCFQPVQCACGHMNDQDDLRTYLDETSPSNDYTEPAMNCGECTSHGTVVMHDNQYVCVECFYFSDEIASCQWCNEMQLGGGDLEESYYRGCEFCEGHSGWDKDD